MIDDPEKAVQSAQDRMALAMRAWDVYRSAIYTALHQLRSRSHGYSGQEGYGFILHFGTRVYLVYPDITAQGARVHYYEWNRWEHRPGKLLGTITMEKVSKDDVHFRLSPTEVQSFPYVDHGTTPWYIHQLAVARWILPLE